MQYIQKNTYNILCVRVIQSLQNYYKRKLNVRSNRNLDVAFCRYRISILCYFLQCFSRYLLIVEYHHHHHQPSSVHCCIIYIALHMICIYVQNNLQKYFIKQTDLVTCNCQIYSNLVVNKLVNDNVSTLGIWHS